MKQFSLPILGLLVSCMGFSIILVSSDYEKRYGITSHQGKGFQEQLLKLIKEDANEDKFLKLINAARKEYLPHLISWPIEFTPKSEKELHGAELNLKEYYAKNAHNKHFPPLYIATILRKPNAARAIVNLSPKDDNSVIGLLFQDNVPGRLKWFLDNNIISLNWRNGYGSLLMAAGDYGRSDLVKILLEAGADPDLTADGSAQAGTTPVDNTATFRNSLDKYSDRVQKAWNDFKAQQKAEANEQLRKHKQHIPSTVTEPALTEPHVIPTDVEKLIEGYYK